MTARRTAETPWSVPLRRDDVPEQGLHLDLVADAATRAAIAAVAGVRALPHLAASFDVAPQGAGLRVAGEVRATVEQTCVVTLEPLTSEVNEPIDLVFVAGAAAVAPEAEAAETIDPAAVDDPETLVDGVADRALDRVAAAVEHRPDALYLDSRLPLRETGHRCLGTRHPARVMHAVVPPGR